LTIGQYSIPFIGPAPSKLDTVVTNQLMAGLNSLCLSPHTFLGTDRLSLGQVDTEILYAALKNARNLRVEGDEDCRAVFQCFQLGQTNCKTLTAVGDLSQLEDRLWALNLEELDLSSAVISVEQVKLLLEANLVNRTIERINLAGRNLENMDQFDENFSSCFRENINNFTHLDIGFTRIPHKFLVIICEAIRSKSTRLRTLAIGQLTIGRLSSDLLSAVINNICDLDISCASLSPEQVSQLLRSVESSVNLKKLTISRIESLELVDPAEFQTCFKRLHTLSLRWTTLPKESLETIILSSVEGSEIKTLDLEETDLTEVNPELVEAAAGTFQLIQTWRDREGMREILSMAHQGEQFST